MRIKNIVWNKITPKIKEKNIDIKFAKYDIEFSDKKRIGTLFLTKQLNKKDEFVYAVFLNTQRITNYNKSIIKSKKEARDVIQCFYDKIIKITQKG